MFVSSELRRFLRKYIKKQIFYWQPTVRKCNAWMMGRGYQVLSPVPNENPFSKEGGFSFVLFIFHYSSFIIHLMTGFSEWIMKPLRWWIMKNCGIFFENFYKIVRFADTIIIHSSSFIFHYSFIFLQQLQSDKFQFAALFYLFSV